MSVISQSRFEASGCAYYRIAMGQLMVQSVELATTNDNVRASGTVQDSSFGEDY